MITAARAALVMVILTAAIGSVGADAEVRLLLGKRQLQDRDTWKPSSSLDLRSEEAIGFGITLRRETWVIEPLIEALYSHRQRDHSFSLTPIFLGSKFNRLDDTGEARLFELAVGVARHWKNSSRFEPYAAAGVTRMSTELDIRFRLRGPGRVREDMVTLEDASVGVFLEAGLDWRMNERFSLGIQGRIVRRTNFLDDGRVAGIPVGVNGDADYSQLGAVFAWNWPGQ